MNSHTKHKNGHLENMFFSAFFGLVGISRSYVILKPLVGIFRSEVISKPLVGHASQCHVADSLFRHSTAFAVQLKGQHVGIQVGTCFFSEYFTAVMQYVWVTFMNNPHRMASVARECGSTIFVVHS